MTVLTDVHSRRVLITDGEAIDTGDLNAMGYLLYHEIFDNLLLSGAPDAVDDATTPGTVLDLEGSIQVNNLGPGAGILDLAWAPIPGCGTAGPHPSIANTIQILSGGPVMQVVDEPFSDGNGGESTAVFRFGGGETLATAVGDAVNARIDVIEMKLAFVDGDSQSRNFEDATSRAKSSTVANRKRIVQCTIQIKQGTPAATPAYPALTAGFVPLGAIRVPATHNAVHSADNYRDMRVPLGHVVAYNVEARAMNIPGANPWVFTEGNPAFGGELGGPGAATGDAYAFCPVSNKNARLIGVAAYSRNANAAKLVGVDFSSPLAPAVTVLADLALMVGSTGYDTLTMVQLGDECGAVAAPLTHRGTRAPNSRIMTPMWCSGYPAGIARRIAALPETPHRRLAVRITGDATDSLSFVRFYVAHGLA